MQISQKTKKLRKSNNNNDLGIIAKLAEKYGIIYSYQTESAIIQMRGQAEGVFTAAKLYPAGATTNSAAGVRDLAAIGPVL